MSGFFNLTGSTSSPRDPKDNDHDVDEVDSSHPPHARPKIVQMIKHLSSRNRMTIESDDDGSGSMATPSLIGGHSKRSKIPKKLWSSATNPPLLHTNGDNPPLEEGAHSRAPKRSSRGYFVKNTVMAPVVAGKAVVQAGAAMGSTVGNSVAQGGKAMVQGFKYVAFFGRNSANVKSRWENGIELIDSLLDPSSDAYQAMTRKQKKGLQGVKQLLIKNPDGMDKAQHIPRDLIKISNYKDQDKASKAATTMRAPSRVSTKFLLQEYAGVKRENVSVLEGLAEWDDLSDSDEEHDLLDRLSDINEELEGMREISRKSAISRSLGDIPQHSGEMDILKYMPADFKRLSQEDQLDLYEMLTWENLKRWDFNVFSLNTITRRQPLLYTAWAILGAPYSQIAMARHIGLESNDEEMKGYSFMDEFMIPPRKLLDYLRIIEMDYHADNPYHNAIHAADVLQTLHALIQSSLDEEFLEECSTIQLFTILFAAVIHDVDHPGKTNAFHTTMRTELAVMYNDKSVLENWHVAHAFSRMLDIQLLGIRNFHQSMVLEAADHATDDFRECDNNMLCNVDPEIFKTIRSLAIEAVLHTDMTKHFETVNAAKGLLMQPQSEENTWKLLMFMLHLADISSQAKPEPIFHQWSQRCMDEFFAQGDEEEKLGLPMSPNCDRRTTDIPESQIGFIRFIVEPAYKVLGSLIPFVENNVIPIIHENLEYWLAKMDEESHLNSKEQTEIIESKAEDDAVLNTDGII